MLRFLVENLGTIAIGLALIVAVSAAVVKMVLDKKKDQCTGCGCGGGCASCPGKDAASAGGTE